MKEMLKNSRIEILKRSKNCFMNKKAKIKSGVSLIAHLLQNPWIPKI